MSQVAAPVLINFPGVFIFSIREKVGFLISSPVSSFHLYEEINVGSRVVGLYVFDFEFDSRLALPFEIYNSIGVGGGEGSRRNNRPTDNLDFVFDVWHVLVALRRDQPCGA